MKVLVVGDMHIKTNTMDVMSKARDNPNYIILMGDQLDGHEMLKLTCLATLTALVENLTKVAPVIMLVGNHDLINNQQYCVEEHAFTSMKQIKNLVVVDRPMVPNLDTVISGEEPALICVPFVPNGRFVEALDQYMPKELTNWRDRASDAVVFAHQEFKGVVMNKITSTRGDVYKGTWPRAISGHIHERQTLGSNILYVGTPWTTSFATTTEVEKLFRCSKYADLVECVLIKFQVFQIYPHASDLDSLRHIVQLVQSLLKCCYVTMISVKV